MLRPVWDVMILLPDDVTVVGRASAFANWQFTYYNTHGSDWGTFALKTDFVLLSKQCIGFFQSFYIVNQNQPLSDGDNMERFWNAKCLFLFFKTQQTENCQYTTDLLSSLLSTHPGSSKRQDGRRFFRLIDLLGGKSRWRNVLHSLHPSRGAFFCQRISLVVIKVSVV